jgi:hypothetical protein
VEGLLFGAGPWFTVHEVSGQWQELGKAWLGDGVSDGPVRVEGRVRWVDDDASPTARAP